MISNYIMHVIHHLEFARGHAYRASQGYQSYSGTPTYRVFKPIGDTDRMYEGKVGKLLRFSKPHGYAVLEIDSKEVHLHPESLELLTTWGIDSEEWLHTP
jgi:hypothetical protein